jgi:hypothetical protein
MTTNANEPQPVEDRSARSAASLPRDVLSFVARKIARGHVGRLPASGIVAALALVSLLGAAYAIGNPTSAGAAQAGPVDSTYRDARLATSAPAVPGDLTSQWGGISTGDSGFSSSSGETKSLAELQLTTSLETTQIVKTGSMSLEVSDLDKAVAQAQSTVVGLGGYVSQSSRSGSKDDAVASVAYRLPAARWDDALTAMRNLAGRVLSEQTDTTDVTTQVIDLDARLDNLKTTETALQSIMARASAVPDVLAVEQQLSQTQGEIEQLTAERDHLKDQAAMSTLSATFSLPGKTVVTQATQEWDLGKQIDQAAAALVHIGQGLATMAVWAIVVGLPIVVAVLVLMAFLWLVRRLPGRSRRRGATPGSPATPPTPGSPTTSAA